MPRILLRWLPCLPVDKLVTEDVSKGSEDDTQYDVYTSHAMYPSPVMRRWTPDVEV